MITIFSVFGVAAEKYEERIRGRVSRGVNCTRLVKDSMSLRLYESYKRNVRAELTSDLNETESATSTLIVKGTEKLAHSMLRLLGAANKFVTPH